MKILVETSDGLTIVARLISGSPKPGTEYFLEDARNGTGAQNKFFHLLCGEYFNSGCFSDEAKTWLHLREKIKLRLGEGFEKIIYGDDNGNICQVSKSEIDMIPRHIRSNPNRLLGKLKSWGDYTKNQRMRCIENLIHEMMNAGVNTKRFNEILDDFYR